MAEGFVAGMSYESFKDDKLHLYAVIRCLMGRVSSHW